MATTGDAERGVGEVFGDLGNISDIPAEVQGEQASIEPVVVDLEQDDDSNRQQEPPMPMQEKVEVVVTPKEGSDGVSVAFRVRPSFVTFRVEKAQADGRKTRKYYLKDGLGRETLAVEGVDKGSSHYHYRSVKGFPGPRLSCGNSKDVKGWIARQLIDSGCDPDRLPLSLMPNRRGSNGSSPSPARGGGGGGGKGDDDIWIECPKCNKWTSTTTGKCDSAGCGAAVSAEGYTIDTMVQIQCTRCGKWRKISQKKANKTPDWLDTCELLGFTKKPCKERVPATCAIYGNDSSLRVSVGHRIPLTTMYIPVDQNFQSREMTGRHLSYIPGRDELITKPGLDLFAIQKDGTPRHVCIFAALQNLRQFICELHKFSGSFLELYHQGKLSMKCDGRVSAGPLDILGLSDVKGKTWWDRVKEYDEKMRESGENQGNQTQDRLNIEKSKLVAKYFHMHYSGRKCFIGEGSKSFEQGYHSGPIPSWNGGPKLISAIFKGPKETKGERGRQNYSHGQTPLSKMKEIQAVEPYLTSAAQILWRQFQEQLPQAAAHQMRYKQTVKELCGGVDPGGDLFKGTGWNAYSVNVSFRTAAHNDRKNVPGSYSALYVTNVGTPFFGGFYMIPEIRIGFDCRGGSVLFHRSEQDCHGNSDLDRPDSSSERLAFVFYLTKIIPDKEWREKGATSHLSAMMPTLGALKPTLNGDCAVISSDGEGDDGDDDDIERTVRMLIDKVISDTEDQFPGEARVVGEAQEREKTHLTGGAQGEIPLDMADTQMRPIMERDLDPNRDLYNNSADAFLVDSDSDSGQFHSALETTSSERGRGDGQLVEGGYFEYPEVLGTGEEGFDGRYGGDDATSSGDMMAARPGQGAPRKQAPARGKQSKRIAAKRKAGESEDEEDDSSDQGGSDTDYHVEEVMAMRPFSPQKNAEGRRRRGKYPNSKVEYLIKWKGYDESQNSWEPEECCTGAPRKIEEFHAREKVKQEEEKKQQKSGPTVRYGKRLGQNQQPRKRQASTQKRRPGRPRKKPRK